MNRALIIRQPHLDKILSGLKPWEMRSTKTKVRGRIGLIEAGSGMIFGEATLIDCGEALDEFTARVTTQYHQVSDLNLLKKWKYPWMLEDVKRYETPIPYKHPKGAVIWVKIKQTKDGE